MKHIKKIIGTFILIGCMLQLSAQQPMENTMSQYFQSRMLWNPGFTGADGSKIYALQNRSWIGFDGAPVMTALTGEFLFGTNSAVGIQVVSDITGIINKTFGVLNYAYRIKLNKDDQLRIGISLAVSSDRLNSGYIDQGGAADPLLVNSINQNAQFDGNIGFVYKSNVLAIGASFFRIRENFSVKDGSGANLSIGQIGGTYDINVNDKVQIKPLMMLRFYRTTSSLFDIGAQFDFNNLINTMIVYQTSGNMRVGGGLRIKNIADLNLYYNSNVKIANSASQQYELGLCFHLKGKQ